MYLATVCRSRPMRLPISAFDSPCCANSFISTYWSKVTTLLQPSCEDDTSAESTSFGKVVVFIPAIVVIFSPAVTIRTLSD